MSCIAPNERHFASPHLTHSLNVNSISCNIMAGKFYYFAYGSNLLKERIRLNNPSAVFKAIGKLHVGVYLFDRVHANFYEKSLPEMGQDSLLPVSFLFLGRVVWVGRGWGGPNGLPFLP